MAPHCVIPQSLSLWFTALAHTPSPCTRVPFSVSVVHCRRGKFREPAWPAPSPGSTFHYVNFSVPNKFDPPGLTSGMWHFHEADLLWSRDSIGTFDYTVPGSGQVRRKTGWWKSGSGRVTEEMISCNNSPTPDETYPAGCGNKAALMNGVIMRSENAEQGDGHIHARFKVRWECSKGPPFTWTARVRLNRDEGPPLFFVPLFRRWGRRRGQIHQRHPH